MCEMLDDSSRFLWIAIDDFADGHRVTLGRSLDGGGGGGGVGLIRVNPVTFSVDSKRN